MPLELVYPEDLLEGVMKQVKPPVVLTQVCPRCRSSLRGGMMDQNRKACRAHSCGLVQSTGYFSRGRRCHFRRSCSFCCRCSDYGFELRRRSCCGVLSWSHVIGCVCFDETSCVWKIHDHSRIAAYFTPFLADKPPVAHTIRAMWLYWIAPHPVQRPSPMVSLLMMFSVFLQLMMSQTPSLIRTKRTPAAAPIHGVTIHVIPSSQGHRLTTIFVDICSVAVSLFLCQSSVAERLPSWQTSLCMDDDGAWIKTASAAPAVPDDAALPSPDDLAYVVMR